MAGIGAYGISAADIAAEMPGLFAVGFTQATKPTLATVEGWILDADTYIDTVAGAVIAVVPDSADTAARLARQYVLDEVLLRVYRATYAGKLTPVDLAAATADMGGDATLKKLQALPADEAALAAALLEAEESAASHVSVPYTTAQRSLEVDDTDLDRDSGYRSRW